MRTHFESHRSERIGWLRAAVLGANDGIVSNASLIVGVAATGTSKEYILVSGLAALVAGAMSMAAGEYVSVSSQSDTEKADLAKEENELLTNPAHELEELTQIYIGRGLDHELASKVAKQLMEHNALESHARDELGIVPHLRARPLQAALVSAITFACGAALPLLVLAFSLSSYLILKVSIVSLISLGALGALASKAGGAKTLLGALRVVLWGALAMGITAGIGVIFKIEV